MPILTQLYTRQNHSHSIILLRFCSLQMVLQRSPKQFQTYMNWLKMEDRNQVTIQTFQYSTSKIKPCTKCPSENYERKIKWDVDSLLHKSQYYKPLFLSIKVANQWGGFPFSLKAGLCEKNVCSHHKQVNGYQLSFCSALVKC